MTSIDTYGIIVKKSKECIKIKKLFLSLLSFIILFSSIDDISAKAESQNINSYTASLIGIVGAERYFGEGNQDNSKNIKPINANITGNGTYTVAFVTTQQVQKIQLLSLQVFNLTANDYPNLNISIKSIKFDDNEISSYKTSESALDLQNKKGACINFVYLTDLQDIPIETGLISKIEVQFSISGMPNNSTIGDTIIKGDVNENGTVEVDDASLILSEYASVAAGLDSLLTPHQKLCADVDENNEINVDDASKVLAFYAANAAGLNPNPDKYFK